MTRREYHREYYRRNIERRREQAASYKRRSESKTISELLRVWKR